MNIADKVATALNHAMTAMVEDIKITNISENFIDDTFTQQINIEVSLKDTRE